MTGVMLAGRCYNFTPLIVHRLVMAPLFVPYARSLFFAAVLGVLLCGCATTAVGPRGGPTDSDAVPAKPSTVAPSNVEPPPPNVNLSGFPLTYRQGYADGCTSAAGTERKDATRFAADGNYRTGWQDGLAICRKK
jgi:hypothetical protein